MTKPFILLAVALFFQIEMFASVHIYEYGLLSAKTGVDRYWVLYNAHCDALAKNTSVDYTGIKTIDIEIPHNAKTIPLGRVNNFSGVTITVLNNIKDMFLFLMKNKSNIIELSKDIIDGSNFRQVSELREGIKLLIIKDENPWVENRIGYSYGATRCDIRVLENGMAKNTSVMPYNNNQSAPCCAYISTDSSLKTIQDLTFKRREGSKYNTRFVDVDGVNNIILKDMSFYTPDDEKYGDMLFRIHNSANVTLRNLTVDGTYSMEKKYGYAFEMNNVWNFKAYNVLADAKWGVFGTNNMSDTYLENCNINRFDIHCYGRNITSRDCIFHKRLFSMASVYGRVEFYNCLFDDNSYIYVSPDYNSYVPLDICFKNCEFRTDKKLGQIIYMGRLDDGENKRLELQKKCWPNIKIDGLKITHSPNTKSLLLFKVSDNIPKDVKIDYISNIKIRNLDLGDGDVKFDLCNNNVVASRSIKYSITRKNQKKISGRTIILGK